MLNHADEEVDSAKKSQPAKKRQHKTKTKQKKGLFSNP